MMLIKCMLVLRKYIFSFIFNLRLDTVFQINLTPSEYFIISLSNVSMRLESKFAIFKSTLPRSSLVQVNDDSGLTLIGIL